MYTLGEIPRSGATLFPDKVAVVFEGEHLTYKKLNDRINCLSNALTKLGCEKGDRITILSENTHKYVEVYYAAAKAGISVTPLNFRLSDSEVTGIVNDSESILYVAGDGYEDRSLGLRKDLKSIKTWISLDKRIEGYLFYEDLIRGASKSEPMVQVDENELAVLLYTGGTTGFPKGVMLSHRNLITSALSIMLSYNFTRNDSACQVLPLFHVAFWTIFSLLIVGGKVVILRRPDIEEILRLIQNEKCTHVNLAPTLLNWILNYPRLGEFDASSLTLIAYGGSPIAPEVLRKALQTFSKASFAQGYGLTESAGFVSWLKQEDHNLILEGKKPEITKSIGKGAPFVEVRVADENDVPVKPGEIGEIVARGKNVMMGYWKQPDLTAGTLRGGWLKTGDMGTVDQDGYIYLMDRKADMIITGGENVYPKETEDILYEHPAVQECAVVPAPDEKWGERIHAVVVLKTGKTTTEEELINFCKSKLAHYKCPKQVEFWKELPKTPIGKIMRKEVKAYFWKDHARKIG
jgi:acyl-CoA synthetase (AMP-forming)/AMP-acid ligase II